MQGLFVIAVFVGFLGLMLGAAAVLSRWQANRARANLMALARDLDLQVHESPSLLGGLFPQVPTASGQYAGRALRFYRFTTGSGKQRQTWQALGLACANPHELTFRLEGQNMLTAIGVLLGMQDVQVGDPAFDRRFVVKTNAPDFLRAALLPEIRAALLQGWPSRAGGPHVKLEGGEVVYAELGSLADAAMPARMKAMLEPLRELAALPEVYRR